MGAQEKTYIALLNTAIWFDCFTAKQNDPQVSVMFKMINIGNYTSSLSRSSNISTKITIATKAHWLDSGIFLKV